MFSLLRSSKRRILTLYSFARRLLRIIRRSANVTNEGILHLIRGKSVTQHESEQTYHGAEKPTYAAGNGNVIRKFAYDGKCDKLGRTGRSICCIGESFARRSASYLTVVR